MLLCKVCGHRDGGHNTELSLDGVWPVGGMTPERLREFEAAVKHMPFEIGKAATECVEAVKEAWIEIDSMTHTQEDLCLAVNERDEIIKAMKAELSALKTLHKCEDYWFCENLPDVGCCCTNEDVPQFLLEGENIQFSWLCGHFQKKGTK